jgi:hypothetical protein
MTRPAGGNDREIAQLGTGKSGWGPRLRVPSERSAWRARSAPSAWTRSPRVHRGPPVRRIQASNAEAEETGYQLQGNR